MSWLHLPPALSCGNEAAFDEAKPVFDIAWLGCARWGFRCLCGESPQLDGKGAESAFSSLTFPRGENRKLFFHRINAHWGLRWWLQGGFGWWGALSCSVSTFLQRPIAWMLKNNTLPCPEGGRWLNEGRTPTLTAAREKLCAAGQPLSPEHLKTPQTLYTNHFSSQLHWLPPVVTSSREAANSRGQMSSPMDEDRLEEIFSQTQLFSAVLHAGACSACCQEYSIALARKD